ncbi:hypothetical protein NL676_014253 [Syzygium grande]|nr:hypothetical protein NL676_014253 [Syzygium grande]
MARQQQNHTTQLPAAAMDGPRDDDGGEHTYKLFGKKTALKIIKEVHDRDEGPNFSYFTTTPEEYFGLPMKPNSTDGAALSKGKEHEVKEKGRKLVSSPH